MDETSGWVKIHRQMLDNPVVMKTCGHMAVWLFFLIKAAHKDSDISYNGRRHTLHAGQLAITLANLCKITTEETLTKQQVRTILQDFERDGQITRETSAGGTIITITNWGLYQGNNTPSTHLINCVDNTPRGVLQPKNKEPKNPVNTSVSDVGKVCYENEKRCVANTPYQQPEKSADNTPATHHQHTEQECKNVRKQEDDYIYNNNPQATNARAREEAGQTVSGSGATPTGRSGAPPGEKKPVTYIKRNPTEEDIDAFFEYFKQHPDTKIQLHSEEELKRDYEVRYIDPPDGAPAPAHRG